MLEALIRDATPEAMAGMAIGRMRKKMGELEGALDGRVGEHHRFLLRLQLDRLKAVDADLANVDGYVDARLEPYRSAQRFLETIPGVGAHTATAILSEIGADVSSFPSAKHFAAWVGVCPGNNESAGKKMRAGIRKGNRHLRKALVEATLGAVRKGGSYLKAKYYKFKARCGVQRAAIAIAHKLAVAVYHVLSKGVAYADLGEAHLDKIASPRTTRHLVRRLEALGYRVTIEQALQTP